MKKIFYLVSILILTSTLKAQTNYTKYVDPFIGTGGHGHTYPGASLPFGMVQLSPDTDIKGWDWCSGYHYSDNSIMGFSHTHLSGTGIGDYGDIMFMPTVGKIKLNPGSKENPDEGYRSRFDHTSEIAEPGYYSVTLKDYKIKTELTSTLRAGIQKYTFPESDKSNIIIDLTHGISDIPTDLKIEVIDKNKIAGYRRSTGWAKDQIVYFYAQFSKPFDSFGIAVNDSIKNDLQKAQGKNIKAFVRFSTTKEEEILIKTGISSVSVDGAKNNLQKEIPDWDFEKIRRDAKRAWDKELNKIEVSGGTKDQKTIFYTALYHTLLNPNLFMDVDGNYPGEDKKIHNAFDNSKERNFTNYTVFSLWDTFRAAHPLFTILEPFRVNDFIKTFLHKYNEGGILPIWELAANETGTMIGYHSIPVIVDAFMKGYRNYDVQSIYEAMKVSADKNWLGLKYYREQGFVPADKENESVSKTLEYSYDDWCISIMAKELGFKKDYVRFSKRAQFYKNLFDDSTKFMRAKRNGNWLSPFDPFSVSGNYTEANAWQYSFFVPQDIPGLINLYKGKENFTKKLDQLFSVESTLRGIDQPDISGMIGQYAHGNEPSHHIAYLYDYAGAPYKTQEKIRQILNEMYSANPDGLSGNEDCGQMSAWYVFSAIGFYPVTPGMNYYAIGSPIFDAVTIHLDNNKKFVINAVNNSKENRYIESASLNGKEYSKVFLNHSDIMNGGILNINMSRDSKNGWGTKPEDTPPSFSFDRNLLPVPVIVSSEKSFEDSQIITIYSETPGTKIFYTTDGSLPNKNSLEYKKPFTINRSTVVKAITVK
ncbi:MAG TPA: GH92 family glycosyl hydrolase, partial [Ignavibacteriaceae bacterium]|nr:GH92 family glycosyl hydrolase [Ignavibacteriaceae bacterium]